MRITKVTTGTGDDGTTSLSRGERVTKDDPRIAALGSLDEINSAIGVVLSFDPVPDIAEVLTEIQNALFNIGGELAVVDHELDLVTGQDVEFLEGRIRDLNSSLSPLEEFVLPGGSRASAHLHLARSVCRRAERDFVSLSQKETVKPASLTYLNRLSDFLFVAARYQNLKDGGKESQWERKARNP
ncbi:MAG: cob(I)yrinic acid a,c-diamide adenosyltransferase [Candidatus Neomarinimicrobiota bacterium]